MVTNISEEYTDFIFLSTLQMKMKVSSKIMSTTYMPTQRYTQEETVDILTIVRTSDIRRV